MELYFLRKNVLFPFTCLFLFSFSRPKINRTIEKMEFVEPRQFPWGFMKLETKLVIRDSEILRKSK